MSRRESSISFTVPFKSTMQTMATEPASACGLGVGASGLSTQNSTCATCCALLSSLHSSDSLERLTFPETVEALLVFETPDPVLDRVVLILEPEADLIMPLHRRVAFRDRATGKKHDAVTEHRSPPKLFCSGLLYTTGCRFECPWKERHSLVSSTLLMMFVESLCITKKRQEKVTTASSITAPRASEAYNGCPLRRGDGNAVSSRQSSESLPSKSASRK
mmetsp:Transcript_39591/g.104924  ORF Transcript_39591/g.104924 Transcript_39591/m.104924 type:complete len:219 (-) Transcript_39591:372-1028(-)